MDAARRDEIYQQMMESLKHIDLDAMFRRAEADHAFADEHREQWTHDYPDQWIVVHGQKLVGVGPDMEAVYNDVRRSGIPLNEAYVEFLYRERPAFIL